MNRLFLSVTLLCLCTAFSLYGQTVKRVLFIGNSYTSYNNLPNLVASMAANRGDQMIFESITPGGMTLNGHYNTASTIAKIQSGNWDFVVLQEQSQYPSFPIYQVNFSVFPYARKLDSLVNKYNPCAETIFYMTWGRKFGDDQNCDINPVVCSYEGMDSLLKERYIMMAEQNSAILSPVGVVWRELRTNYPQIELYTSDNSHPSYAGSYAAACSFYTAIFRKDPSLVTWNGSMNAADAATIRNVAKSVVFDNTAEWFIGEYDPVANFQVTDLGNNTFQFNNSSINASEYTWDFGDGTTSTDANVTHTFPNADAYWVTLTASHCDLSSQKSFVVNDNGLSVDKSNSFSVEMYPNPVVNKQFKLSTTQFEELEIVDVLGRSVAHVVHTSNGTTVIDIDARFTGTVFIRLNVGGYYVTKKLMIL